MKSDSMELAEDGVLVPIDEAIEQLDEPQGFVVPIEFANKLAEFGGTCHATAEAIEAVCKSLREE